MTSTRQVPVKWPGVTLVIPAHNEERRLGPTLDEYVVPFVERWGDAFEIVVVSNGSRDRTVDVAQVAAERWPQIRVITIEAAIGKGGAILEGFRQARGSRIAFADADGATDPRSLLDLIDGLDRHDLAIGSRRLQASRVIAEPGLLRRALSLLFRVAVRATFGLPIADTQCGAKALRRDAALALAACVEERRWAFDVDLLVRARDLGYSVLEAPVTWQHKDGSRLRILATALEIGQSLWRIKSRTSARATVGQAVLLNDGSGTVRGW